MKIDTIIKKIDSKKNAIAKLETKLARIKEAQASGWTKNPYYYNEDDLRYTTRDINEAKALLQEYEKALEVETEKANSRNIEVILTFLDNWKTTVFACYAKAITEYYTERAEVKALRDAFIKFGYMDNSQDKQKAEKTYREANNRLKEKAYGYFIKVETIIYGRLSTTKKKVKDGELEFANSYFKYDTEVEARTRLIKDLEDEANRKYDFIIERTNKIVGEIKDASNLTIGGTGELNGYIAGTRGKAKVNTIGAGGYNIQVYHFRTLIKPMK